MREVAWVIFDEIHYMRDKGMIGRYFLSSTYLKFSYRAGCRMGGDPDITPR